MVFVLKCVDLFKENASSSSSQEFVCAEIQSTVVSYFCRLTLGFSVYLFALIIFRVFSYILTHVKANSSSVRTG